MGTTRRAATTLKPAARSHSARSRRMCRWHRLLALSVTTSLWTGVSAAGPRSLDTAKSVMTVRVFKAGVFSAFGHDHEITAPVRSGQVDTAAGSVELHVDAAALKVRDPETSEKDRAEIQRTMLGPEVLDSERHPQIVFQSSGAQRLDGDSWMVRGNLTLHGETHPLEVEVHETGGHYRGNARFRQTEFGIKPVKVAGGTVRVKDEVRVEFDIQLRP